MVVVLITCPALVRSVGDSVAFLMSTSFLLYMLGMLLVVNVNNKFSLFSELGWQVPVPS